MKTLIKIVEDAFEKKTNIFYDDVIDPDLYVTLQKILDKLNDGTLRVSEKIGNNWITHQWVKKAIILLFRIMNNKIIKWGDGRFFDKIPMKFSNWDHNNFQNKKLRIIPPASVRYGSYIANNTVIMPSYINVGAYIDTGTMIDTWATIGSCAQIGKNVHISGGVGIGGILEPIQLNPTIIENNCFIGARSEIVEGVIIEENSVISMGVFIGKSTKIYHKNSGKIYYGKVPAGSVVVPGSLPSKDGLVNIYCAVIIKNVDEKTKCKTKLNELLRM